MELFQQIVKEGDVVVDAGANIGMILCLSCCCPSMFVHSLFHYGLGLFTLNFSRLVGATGRVHAFEPQPFIFNILAGNLALNARTNVDVHHAALGTMCVHCSKHVHTRTHAHKHTLSQIRTSGI